MARCWEHEVELRPGADPAQFVAAGRRSRLTPDVRRLELPVAQG